MNAKPNPGRALLLAAAVAAFSCNAPKCREVKPAATVEKELRDQIEEGLDALDATPEQTRRILALSRRAMPEIVKVRDVLLPQTVALLDELERPAPSRDKLVALYRDVASKIHRTIRELVPTVIEMYEVLDAKQRAELAAKDRKPRKPFQGSWVVDRAIDLFLWQIDATDAQRRATLDLKSQVVRLGRPLQEALERERDVMLRELARDAPDPVVIRGAIDRVQQGLDAFAVKLIDYYVGWRAKLEPKQRAVLDGYLSRFEPCAEQLGAASSGAR